MTPDEAAARFAALVNGGVDVPLDETALLIGARAHPELDVGHDLALLDDIAARCPEPTLEGLTRHLFGAEGFAGNTADYYDPRNSYLSDVLARRLGIPITLGVVLIEVGRRVGVPLAGVNMPGHFLVRTIGSEVPTIVDPFAAGAPVSWAESEARFMAANPDGVFSASVLAPVPPVDVLSRMLANLRHIFRTRRDAPGLAWALRLRTALPGAAVTDRLELASALTATGQFLDAARIYEAVAAAAGGEARQKLEAKATSVRARLN